MKLTLDQILQKVINRRGFLQGLVGVTLGAVGAIVGINSAKAEEPITDSDWFKEEYDAKGNKVKETWDTDNDGKPNSSWTWEYDDKGKKIRQIFEKRNLGLIQVETTEYNDKGKITKETYDFQGDGKIDDVHTYEYDDEGKLIKKTYLRKNSTRVPNDIDTFTYKYNDQGELVQATRDFYFSPRQKTRDTFTYEYDDKGKLKKEIVRIHTDGKADSITTYESDGKGHLAKKTDDINADGRADIVRTYELDGNGKLIERSRLLMTDGSIEEVVNEVDDYERERGQLLMPNQVAD